MATVTLVTLHVCLSVCVYCLLYVCVSECLKSKSDMVIVNQLQTFSLWHLFVCCRLNVTVYGTLCSFGLLLKFSSRCFFLTPLVCASLGVLPSAHQFTLCYSFIYFAQWNSKQGTQ